ncbi:MAG: alpha/beta fold hydrolase [Planctomycetaceae bacterium]|nr:alpha/beta fold hydrolase [Planctomycetaceae bacterium]
MRSRLTPNSIVLCACLMVRGVVPSSHAADATAPAYPDHSRLLVYFDADNVEIPIQSTADWQVRRRHILAGMEQAMGPLPDRANLPVPSPKITASIQGDGYTRLTISFEAEPGDLVPAYLYLPTGLKPQERRPAILALHPTGPAGKGIVDDQGPRPNRGYGKELAQRGYVVLAPDYPSFGDYANYDFASDRYDSGSMKGIFNHIRALDLLAARDDVDPERMGAIGHSLGGHNAMFVGVFDERLKVIVSSCGWTPFHDYYEGKIAGWTSDRYMPRLKDRYDLDPSRVPFDFYEVIAALAPRAFFSVSPEHDSNFAVAGVRKAIPAARAIYDLYGAGERLQVAYPDCEHDFPDAMRREAYTFIDKFLEHKPAQKVP